VDARNTAGPVYCDTGAGRPAVDPASKCERRAGSFSQTNWQKQTCKALTASQGAES
jgi:hypothetical protein